MRPSRTLIALVLTSLAVVTPCVAWYLAGSSALEQQVEGMLEEPVKDAQREAERLAHQLSVELEALKTAESRRPHTDYIHDPDMKLSDCSDELRLFSPLAFGPTDPLVWTHFQIDSVGRLSLPTLRTDEDAITTILDELECAGELLADTGGEPATAETLLIPTSAGTVTVGPFRWNTTSIKNQPALVALRDVTAPSTTWSQGFVVLGSDLDTLISDDEISAWARPGDLIGPGEAGVSFGNESWIVSVDVSRALDAAYVEAAAVRSRFLLRFTLGALGALLVGVCLVALVASTERLGRERARFAASAAHELRTPLAGLQLYGEMIAEGKGDPAKGREYARRIADEAERLGRVVSNVLSYTRLQRNNLTVRVESGDLSTATRDSVEKLRPILEAHGAELACRIRDDLPPARFDRDALHQILMNLLDNAEKYSRGGNRTIRVELTTDDDGIVLSVLDRGEGVAPALRGRLFRPFSRTKSPDSPAGLGVGLALVDALARAQGARVSHRDGQDGGSVFSVHFPAAV